LQERERQVEHLEQEKAELLKQTQGSSSGGSDLQSKLSAAQEEIESLKSFNEATSQQMLAKMQEMQQDRDNALQKLEEKSQHFQSHVQSLEKNSGNRKQQLIEASEQIDTLRNTVQMLESQLLTSAQSRQTLEKNLQQETLRRDTVCSQLNEEIASLQAALQAGGSGAEAVAAAAAAGAGDSEDVEQLKKRNESLYGNLQTALQELKLSNAKVQEMRSDNEQLANAVSNYHEKYRRLLAKVQDQPDEGAAVDIPDVKEETIEAAKEVVEESAAPEQQKEEVKEEETRPRMRPPASVNDHGLDDLAAVVKDVKAQ